MEPTHVIVGALAHSFAEVATNMTKMNHAADHAFRCAAREIKTPHWEVATATADWQRQVPTAVRAMWNGFTPNQRFALAQWADELAGAAEYEVVSGSH